MRKTILYSIALCMLCSCNKAIDSFIEKQLNPPSVSQDFIHYTIKANEHSSDKSTYRAVELTELNFTVKFDSSAIYQTAVAENQYDINKLYGFSDNGSDHHRFSARIGWRWSDQALRLFAYVYNDGFVSSKELTSIPLYTQVNCSIKVAGDHYVFTVNDVHEIMPRSSTIQKAKGYQLYPYFGGDETAPHDVHIWIRNL